MQVTGEIGRGLLVLAGVRQDDTPADACYLASRTVQLRIFNDNDAKMNLSLQDTGGEILVVSQFTLHADTRKGNRPSYGHAANHILAEKLYENYVEELRRLLGPERIATGIFAAMMSVELVNDGPVTIILKSKNEYRDTPSRG